MAFIKMSSKSTPSEIVARLHFLQLVFLKHEREFPLLHKRECGRMGYGSLWYSKQILFVISPPHFSSVE